MGRSASGAVEGFDAFVDAHERRLCQAFSAMWGATVGREVAVDVFSYAWEHWDRVGAMENPVGYLFVVGRDRGRRRLRGREQPSADASVLADDRSPEYEPALAGLVDGLPTRERQVVMLLYGFEWSMSEVGELLGVSKSTVQTHAERALTKLRAGLGVRS